MELKNNKSIIGIIILVIFLLFLFLFASSSKEPMLISSGDASADVSSGDASADYEYTEYEVDSNQDIIDLFTTYYNAYANGDLDTLETVASPLSEFERNYITVMSEYVESYNDLKVYVKSGLDDNSYIVSASIMMKFDDIDTEAPGIETYYVQKDENGKYMINNVYSWFNLSSGEQSADETIVDRINAYKSEADIAELFASIESSYAAALESDDALNTMVTETVPNAISTFVTGYADDNSDNDSNSDAAVSDNTATSSVANDSSDDTNKSDADADNSAEQTTNDSKSNESSAEETTAQTIAKGTSIYLQETLVVRSEMSSESDRIGNAYGGETLVVIKSYDTGWTKVKWGHKRGYVRTDLLLEQ